MKTCITFLILISASAFCFGQSESKNIDIKISAPEISNETIFHLNNINGEIEVIGYDGSEIIISGEKSVWRKHSDTKPGDIDKVNLEQLRDGDHLFVFVEAPGFEAYVEDGELHYDDWGRTNKSERKKLRYEVRLEVKIPKKMKAHISTMNGEFVNVENIHGFIEANSFNGDISMVNVSGETHAKTLNGDIILDLAKTPPVDIKLHTLNGNIEVTAPQNLSAVVTFQSLHGDLYTNFDKIEYLPKKTLLTSKNGKKHYKLNQNQPVKFGNGGPEISIDILNGNAYIKRKN